MSDIYCGIKPVPKNKTLGSMKQCANAQQVRYYGIKKVDKKLLETKKTKSKNDRMTIIKEMSKLKGILHRLDREIRTKSVREDPKKKSQMEKDIANTKKKYNEKAREYNNKF